MTDFVRSPRDLWAKFMSCCQPECRRLFSQSRALLAIFTFNFCLLFMPLWALALSFPQRRISLFYIKNCFSFYIMALWLENRGGKSQGRRVIAFYVGEFKWKWIQYCIFTPKCFQKQIFHLHFLNGAIRITCPTGPKHWFCSCALNGVSSPPIGLKGFPPPSVGNKKYKKKNWNTDGHCQYTLLQRLFVFWMPFEGQRTRFRTLFHRLSWGN